MKRSIGQLALFGSEPAFAQPLHTGRPFVGNRDRLLQRINEALDRRWLTNDGPLLNEFARALQHRVEARHVIPVANGTLGLEVTARALDLTGEVIVPSFTFVATAHALQWLGLEPVFCDVDPSSHNIDPAAIEALITPRTSAIVGVHLWGRPCSINELEAIARRHRLRLIFDAAHAFNVSSHGRKIGNFGDAEIFSFHATKFVNTLEGGAIATNDSQLAEKIRLMINFGFSGYDTVASLGINAKMNEFSAAMGLTLLESVEELVEHNARNYHTYVRELSGIDGLKLLAYDQSDTPNYQYVVAEIDAERFGVSRDDVVAILHAENVLARRYFYPGCHRMPPYNTRNPPTAALPSTDALAARVLCLPSGAEIGSEAVFKIARLLEFIHEHAAEVVNGIRAMRSESSSGRRSRESAGGRP